MCLNLKNGIIAVVVGMVVALLTGAINTTPNLVGASWYGWPMAWYTIPVVPNPVWNINYTNLLIDIVVWIVIALVLLAIASYAMKGKKRRKM